MTAEHSQTNVLQKQNPGHRYATADAEISGFFTCAVGLKGQSYDSTGGGAFDAASASERMLKGMKWLSGQSSALQWHDRVASSFVTLTPEHRTTLSLIYTPHAWPATWMASALASPWGGGSMASLAMTLPRAVQGLRRWLLEVDRPSIEEWKHRSKVCGRLVQDGEELRLVSLAAYDVVRKARIAHEAAYARAYKARRALLREELLAQELGMDRRIARARFEHRTRKVAA